MSKSSPSKITEKDVQKAILEWLQWKGYFVWKNHTTGIYNKKGGGFIPAGMTGVSDILGVLEGGRFLAIEVKKPGGHLSHNQQIFLYEVNKRGGLAFMASSIEDVELKLEKK